MANVSQHVGPPPKLYVGCEPAILCDPGGHIVAVAEDAMAAAGGDATIIELEGRALPGLGDAHIHLDELVLLRVGLDLHGTRSRQEVLDAVRTASLSLPPAAWIVGRGWNYHEWPQPQLPSRHDLDEAGGGRPVLLASKDEHSVWVSSAALQLAEITNSARSGEPTNVALANSWIVINRGGGPTDDKPAVTLETPRDLDRVSSFLNIRVKDIEAVYAEWSARGAQFLTPPKQHQYEIRCYIRDPDGHLIEVGQTTDSEGDWTPPQWLSNTPAEESQ